MSIFPNKSHSSKKGRKAEISPLTSQVIGILLTTFGVMLCLSVVSFHPQDPILFVQHDIFSDSRDAESMHNWVGKVGSTLAFSLLSIIGGAAYLASLLLVIFGVRSWASEDVWIRIRHVCGALLAVVSLSTLSQFRFSSVPMLGDVVVGLGMAGGITGYWLAWALEQNFAYLGSHILLAAGFVVALVLLAPTSIPGTARRLTLWGGTAKEAVQARMALRAEERELHRTVKPNKSVKINRSLPVRGGIGTLLSGTRGEDKSHPSLSVKAEEVSTSQESEEAAASSNGVSPVPVYGAVSKTYRSPSPSELLTSTPGRSSRQTDHVLETQSQVLTETLENFGIEGKVTEVHPGPVITMYEFAPGPGIKVSRIVGLADDLAMALKALRVRVVAPLPGKSTVGIEVPNPIRETVSLKDMLTSSAFLRSQAKLALALGKDIYGNPVVSDLRTMPHLLVAGATGAGKSVGLNCMLLNILFTAHPDEVKLLLIDPKVLELQVYDGIPHLIRPVITDPKSAARGLTWVVQEMERRYRLLAEHGVRSVDAYNRKVAELQGSPSLKSAKKKSKPSSKAEETDPASDDSGETPLTHLPYIVVVIDEFADLMMVAPKEVEDRIARLAQMARASGIHLILATQRPSVDVVTGLIKANFPVRIAYQVSSKIDSRTILDTNGAETLLGKGDMLYMASGSGRITRLHGPFVSDDEVRDVVEWVKQQATPVYEDDEFFSIQESSPDDEVRDETYERARELIMETGQASASFIQRRLRVGYPRAARMIEQMESEGLVSTPGRDGRREVLVRQAVMGEAG